MNHYFTWPAMNENCKGVDLINFGPKSQGQNVKQKLTKMVISETFLVILYHTPDPITTKLGRDANHYFTNVDLFYPYIYPYKIKKQPLRVYR